ncbi:MAG: recombination protein RecR [Candidatus Moranbacteria bacterium]|nr:recombination protein RecR [Candidatus Moranbacteria bacterium]
MDLPQTLVELRKLLASMPGISLRGAERFLDFWWREDLESRKKIGLFWNDFTKVARCESCFYFVERGRLCQFCQNENRDKKKICVVSSAFTVPLVERQTSYRGIYYVLDGEIIGRDGSKQLLTVKKRRDYLKNRIIKEKLEEVIIATDYTSSGEATALFIKEEIKELPVKVTRLARGFQSGDILSYSDPVTIKKAFESRSLY